MKKKEYVEVVSTRTGISKKETLIVLDGMLEMPQECLVKKENMRFS